MITEDRGSIPDSGLLALARKGVDEVRAIRRDIHAHPELGLEEVRTSALVAKQLAEWGVANVTPLAGTGLVATITGDRPSDRVIGLRADMDALALQEANTFAHASRHPGRMHACGHDGHTAMLLGAARRLAENPDFAGTVHLIFQPAEEGRGGAAKMIGEGLFERFACDRIYGLHSYPELPLGRFGTRTGPLMAASGRWSVTLSGDGGHGGAGPHLTQDLSVVAAGFISGLQAVVARNVSAFDPAVISVGYIRAGSSDALNVLPSELVMGGTMRAFDSATQSLLDARISELAELHARSQGASHAVEVRWDSVPVVNEAEATATAVEAAAGLVGAGNVDPNQPQTSAGEDFSFMLRECPGNFMFLGNGSHDGEGGGQLHTPNYDFNDEALPYGIAYWLALVASELGGRFVS